MMKIKTIKRCAFGTLILIILLLIAATIVEKFLGSQAAYEKMYGAWWFIIIWIILVITSGIYLIRRWKTKSSLTTTSLLFHCSFIVILLGAFVTYLSAERGYIHIRQGDTVNHYYSEEDIEHSLPFDVKLVLFDIEYHPGTEDAADYISYLKIDEDIRQVSMNKIYKGKGYRLYQYSFDSDEMGTTLLVNHDPWGIGISYTGYLLLALSMIILLFQRIRWKGVFCLLIPTVALWYYISQINPMTPILRSPMLAAHVSIIMISYVLLLLITIFSIVGVASKKQEKKMYQWNTRLLYPALFFLAAGIFIGAVWANISWGRYWGWDAKETWALITMLIYAFPFHRQSIPFFRKPKNFHVFCIFAFLSILMTFLGVSYLLGGMHSYL